MYLYTLLYTKIVFTIAYTGALPTSPDLHAHT